jgi:hypothetical protein
MDRFSPLQVRWLSEALLRSWLDAVVADRIRS